MSNEKAISQTYGYIRISTEKQDKDNQKHIILEYANSRDLGRVRWVEDTKSGKLPWRERGIKKLIDGLLGCIETPPLYSMVVAPGTRYYRDSVEGPMEPRKLW